MNLLVGLGNRGDKYQFNRHNVGFMVLEKLAEELNLAWDHQDYLYHSDVAKNSEKILLKPGTFVNDSGLAVQKLAEEKGIEPANLWVIHDDTEFPLGEVRIKFGGTSGGHNGIKSIDDVLGSPDYWRIRIGVGRPENREHDLADYVLGNFTAEEKPVLDTVIDRTISYLLKCLKEGTIASETFSVNYEQKTTN